MIACLQNPYRLREICSPPHDRERYCAVLPDGSVAGRDVRRDTRTARDAASAEAPSVTPPDTRVDDGDRSTALTMIVCPLQCPIRSCRTPSCALHDCPANCRRNSGMPCSVGWALTPFLTPPQVPDLRRSRLKSHTPRA